MESPAPSPRRSTPAPLAALIACFCLPIAAHAADAHRAVVAKPGDIALLRSVPTRPADRSAPPGMALMVSPSPRPEIAAALGGGELSDADIGQLDATPSPAARMQATAVGRMLDSALMGNRNSGSNGTVAGNGVSNTLAAPVGAVGNATRGIGDQVQGALAQLPLGAGH